MNDGECIVYFLFMFDSTVNCTDNTVLTLTAAVTAGTKVVSNLYLYNLDIFHSPGI